MFNSTAGDEDGRIKPGTNSLLWALVYVALGLGGANGVFVASSTDDRYTATDANKDLRSVYIELANVKDDIAYIRQKADRLDQEDLKNIDLRLRALELKLEKLSP